MQTIVWREKQSDPLRHLELLTVTYGTNCAPFLATRTLVELANVSKESFPLAAEALLTQTYVDDFLGGSHSLEGLRRLQEELTEMLKSAGFNLHKWNSNIKALSCPLEGSEGKVLGVSWDPTTDTFKIVPKIIKKDVFTKREVLSVIASTFDPMGYVGCIIVISKIFMQKLWLVKLGWDENLPPDLLSEWLRFHNRLSELEKISIPRWMFDNGEIVSIQLVGFSDSSMLAYGACLYIRAVYKDGQVSCNLICSKSRVAPLKTVSLPRLELCGFLLLVRLCDKFRSCMKFRFDQIIMFTDSTIVLAWVQSPPSRWTTFVANRVSEIQELSTNVEWGHVATKLNPADLISRGVDPDNLVNNKLWWEGPEFLKDFHWSSGSQKTFDLNGVPEQRSVSHYQVRVQNWIKRSSLFDKFSSWTKMQRGTARILRLANNARKGCSEIHGTLLVEELEKANKVIFRLFQADYFFDEINCLKEGLSLPRRSNILSLNPFLDADEILRVGGRLTNSFLSFDEKHPIILPTKSYLTDLLINHEHRVLGHAGPQLLLSSLRQRFWLVQGLRRIKCILLRCVKCHRFRAIVSKQLMGSLPPERIQATRPFMHVGIDFGGPIMVKESGLRRSKTFKAYIALFVCMATKATHIELVSSLSTEEFLLTLKRFIARRGNPASISSDNATNFRGASNTLHELYDFFKKHICDIQDFPSLKEIRWKFIPPNSPHWGGGSGKRE